MKAIPAPRSVGISELKANPNAVFESAEGMPVAVLDRNKPVACIVPVDTWRRICEQLEDLDLLRAAQSRLMDGKPVVEAALDHL